MRYLVTLTKWSTRKWSLLPLRTNRSGFVLNRLSSMKTCCYSTATHSPESVISHPPISSESKQYPEKISRIVSDISNLTLIEVSELNELLKKTLNIPDAPLMAMSAMPAGGLMAKQEEEEEDVGSQAVQTSFTLKLNKFDETKKVALIKEIKTVVEGMNLVQAKKFVESVPQIIKSNLPKDEAEKLKAALEAVGGVCGIE